ncbi:MAG: hypothetical protein DMG32_05110 [Acidobacteria bacterium]|nr:MAG: hypothetical protein DMG32_05110 [Acidobacteriota bacterium]
MRRAGATCRNVADQTTGEIQSFSPRAAIHRKMVVINSLQCHFVWPSFPPASVFFAVQNLWPNKRYECSISTNESNSLNNGLQFEPRVDATY